MGAESDKRLGVPGEVGALILTVCHHWQGEGKVIQRSGGQGEVTQKHL